MRPRQNKAIEQNVLGAKSSPVRHTESAFYQRCMEILRCTAQAMSSTPGGLRFKAGSRPWLDGLVDGRAGQTGLQMGG